jgi:hypothetical protein
MGFVHYENVSTLILLTFLFNLSFTSADYFLREPDFVENDHRPRRSIPEWQEKWRQKAISFGRSPEEQQEVQKYMNELSSLAREKHPSNKDNRQLDVSLLLLLILQLKFRVKFDTN